MVGKLPCIYGRQAVFLEIPLCTDTRVRFCGNLTVKKFVGICVLAMLLTMGSAKMVKADGVDTFTYTSSGNTLTWQLPASPKPTSGHIHPGPAVVLDNVAVSENGAAPVMGSFDFYSLEDGGGFDLTIGSNVPIDAW